MFQNIDIQTEFDSKGYVKIPMLTPAEITELSDLFATLNNPQINGIYSNIYDQTLEKNMLVKQTIQRIFSPYFEKVFTEDYKITGGVFLVKSAGDKSECNMHQDWNVVDEEKFTSLSLWCPLVDVNEHNGALLLIDGTHKMFNTVRSTTVSSLWLPFDEDLEPYLTLVPAKAGEAIFYAHNAFHGSKPNYSNQIRVAAVAGVLPEGAEKIHYIKMNTNGKEELCKAEIGEEFYTANPFDLTIDKALKGKHTILPYDVQKTLTREVFFEKLKKNRNKAKTTSTPVADFFKNLFKSATA